jgi:hypothetical protein
LLVPEGGFTKKQAVQEVVQEQSRLESVYERIAVERKSLEELEFDRELGNLTDNDYLSLKQKSENTLTALEDQLKAHEEVLAEAERKRKVVSPVARRETKPKVAASPKANVTSVANRNSRQSEIEAKLKPAVRETMKCSECATPFKPGDKFCSKCGAPLPHICLNCGAELKDDMRFCAKCGAAVND